jgi:hypothetical protein
MHLSFFLSLFCASYFVAAIPLPRSSNVIGVPVIAANNTQGLSTLVDQHQDEGANYQEWLDQGMRARTLDLFATLGQHFEQRGGLREWKCMC